MKTVKLKKSDLNLTLENLLKKFKLVKNGEAYPDRLLMSREDITTLKKNIEKKFKKEYPGLSKAKISSSVGFYFLNLGPSEVLQDAIKPGHVIILEN